MISTFYAYYELHGLLMYLLTQHYFTQLYITGYTSFLTTSLQRPNKKLILKYNNYPKKPLSTKIVIWYCELTLVNK